MSSMGWAVLRLLGGIDPDELLAPIKKSSTKRNMLASLSSSVRMLGLSLREAYPLKPLEKTLMNLTCRLR